jgi:DNA-binding NtrC family response regulator
MPKDLILVVDDEPILRVGIANFLTERGFEVEQTDSLAHTKSALDRCQPDAVVLDYMLPDGSSLELIPEMHRRDPDLPVILLTGHGSIDLAVRAIKEGAENFLTKPVELPVLLLVVERALESRRYRRRAAASRQTLHARDPLNPFTGVSESLRALEREAALALRSDGPVLIQGETGTGKGVLARWLHERGPRRDQPFVDLNCAGLTREFLESELFGHARGAFTGAVSEKKGLFEMAHRGSLFLDEMGDLDPAVQPKVLKALEEKRFRRMGEVQDRYADVFLIAATNRDIGTLVAEGRFRSDLFYRINTFPLHLPPLRERPEDVPVLAERLIAQLGRDMRRRAVRLHPNSLHALQEYPWPGNVRELRNVLERALLRVEEGEICREDLRFPSPPGEPTGRSLTLEEMERRYIETILREERGRVTTAARRLGLPRSTLYQKVKDHAIDIKKLQERT